MKMASENETVADIVAEMRIGDLCANDTTTSMMYINDFLAGYADRIEEAHQREVAELRKGISELLDALQAIYDEECTSCGTGEVYDKWRKALGEE